MIHISAPSEIPHVEGFIAKCTERDAVLHEMADYLAAKGAVKAGYGDAVIARENNYPTGIPTEPIGVAIPHSDRDYVINTTILVAQLPQEVSFYRIDDPDLEIGVRVVFMLAVNSNEGQLDTIVQVMELVQDEALVKNIISAASPEEIQQFVSAAFAV